MAKIGIINILTIAWYRNIIIISNKEFYFLVWFLCLVTYMICINFLGILEFIKDYSAVNAEKDIITSINKAGIS